MSKQMKTYVVTGDLRTDGNSSWLDAISNADVDGASHVEIAKGSDYRTLFEGMPADVGGTMPYSGVCTVEGQAEVNSGGLLRFASVSKIQIHGECIDYIKSFSSPFSQGDGVLTPRGIKGRNDLHGKEVVVAGLCVVSRADMRLLDEPLKVLSPEAGIGVIGISDVLYLYCQIPADNQPYLPTKIVPGEVRGSVAVDQGVTVIAFREMVVRIGDDLYLEFRNPEK